MAQSPIARQGTTDLVALAAQINAEHQACQAAITSGLQHAVAAGRLLLQAKARLTHGRWRPWLQEHFTGAERTAQAYMRVARGAPHLAEGNPQRVADLSYREALRSLAAPRAPNGKTERIQLCLETDAQALRLHERRRLAAHAQATAATCGACGHPLAPDAPVWLARLSVSRDGRQVPVGACCRGRLSGRPEPCVGCGRAVHYPYSTRARSYAYCSDRCRWQIANRRRQALRQLGRQDRICATCAQPFTPPRADGRYCSHACRQRAYRQRHVS
jgi:hypothetical protein